MTFSNKLAQSYLAYFSTHDLVGLASILHPDFQFTGPYVNCKSAQAYISLFEDNSQEEVIINILKVFENNEEICLIYRFKKGSINTTMSQTFRIKENKIFESQLIFDRKAFE